MAQALIVVISQGDHSNLLTSKLWFCKLSSPYAIHSSNGAVEAGVKSQWYSKKFDGKPKAQWTIGAQKALLNLFDDCFINSHLIFVGDYDSTFVSTIKRIKIVVLRVFHEEYLKCLKLYLYWVTITIAVLKIIKINKNGCISGMVKSFYCSINL